MMKASEMIQKLQVMIEGHGDLDVHIDDDFDSPVEGIVKEILPEDSFHRSGPWETYPVEFFMIHQ